MTPARQGDFTDCWLRPAFAKKYVNDNVGGLSNPGVRKFWLRCMMAQLQGIQYLTAEPTKILDAGCGHAMRSAHVKAKLGCDVWGVDYSDSMLEQGRTIMATLPPEQQVTLVKGDVAALPFEDEEFDVVIAYGLFMGLKAPQRGVTELMRVSKHGIVCIEESPDAMSPAHRSAWEDVKDKTFPGRIFWHNYTELFLQNGGARQVVADPLIADEWDLGSPPCYMRYIAVK